MTGDWLKQHPEKAREMGSKGGRAKRLTNWTRSLEYKAGYSAGYRTGIYTARLEAKRQARVKDQERAS